MKKIILYGLAPAAVSGLVFLGAFAPSFGKAKKHKATAIVSATSSAVILEAEAKFVEKNGKVKMTFAIGYPAGAGKSVAVHLHEHGDCGNNGNDAHGHWNPTGSKHGKWGSAEYHLGDIGNVSLDARGQGELTLVTDKWSLGSGAQNDIAGRAIIVHTGVDDYTTQPTGNAGGRIGCGVINVEGESHKSMNH
jgi:superoxide dismutase, Cu-Zn family